MTTARPKLTAPARRSPAPWKDAPGVYARGFWGRNTGWGFEQACS
jgi:hypothetical protein